MNQKYFCINAKIYVPYLVNTERIYLQNASKFYEIWSTILNSAIWSTLILNGELGPDADSS